MSHELGGDHDLPVVRRKRLPDQLLVDIRAVDLSGVEEGDAAIDGSADQRDHVLPIGPVAIATGHAHAAQPDSGDFRPALPTVRLSMAHAPVVCRTAARWPSK